MPAHRAIGRPGENADEREQEQREEEESAMPTTMSEATVRKSVAGIRNVMTHLFQTGLPWALPDTAAKPCRQLG